MAQLPQKGDLNWDFTLNNFILAEHYADGTHNFSSSGGGVTPTGAVIPFAGGGMLAGWLLCDGAEISRTEYADLYTAIADLYGAGDGSATFNLPDLRGEFVRGVDNGRGVDVDRTLGSAQGDDFKSHTHTGSTNAAGNHAHSATVPDPQVMWPGPNGGGNIFAAGAPRGFWVNPSNNAPLSISAAGNHTHTLSINAAGGAETRPRNVAMNYIIKF